MDKTPEKRAQKITGDGCLYGCFYGVELSQIVAQAIREAENAAFERAAVVALDGPERRLTEVVADRIRVLKHD